MAGPIVSVTLVTALSTPLPPNRALSPSRSSTASWTPVEAPDGTAARPTDPSARMTSTSTVGLPRESRISRASTTSMMVFMRMPRLLAGLHLDRAIEQDGHARQLAALEEFERRAAARRDVGHPVGQALLGDGRDRIAAADDDRRAGVGPVGQHPRDRLRAVREGRDLEDAERTVPEDGLDVGEGLDDQVLAGLAEVDDVPRGRDLLGLERLVLGAAGDLLGHDDVDRQDDPDAVVGGDGQDPPGVVDAIGLGQALADGLALREQERVGHPAAEDQQVDLGQEVVDDLDLVGDLGAAEDGRERPLGCLEELRQHLDLALHQEPGIGRQELGDADGRRVGAMGRPERVVDVDVGVGGERGGEGRIVLLLLDMEAQVLEQEHLAGSEALDRVLRPDARARRR